MSLAIALIGSAITVFACVRLIVALRAGAPRELLLGYVAVMLIAAIIVFGVLRLL